MKDRTFLCLFLMAGWPGAIWTWALQTSSAYVPQVISAAVCVPRDQAT